MELRDQVKALVAERGLSIRELSRVSGVRRQSIASFFAGANLHLDNLAKLLQSLGCRLEAIPSLELKDEPYLPIDRKKLASLCRKRGVVKLALFGSILRPDFGPDSDIDILVDFKKPVSFFELATFEEELRILLPKDHPVDLVTPGSLSKHFRRDVLKECEVIYEKAA